MTNPYVTPENYQADYNKSIEKMKHNPEIVAFDKLCYLVFDSEDGKALLEEIQKRFIHPGLCNIAHPNYANQCIYFEGFKEAFRLIVASIKSHQQRIDAEKLNPTKVEING